MPLRQLRRVRWAVRASLALGVAASVAANILHAHDNLIAQTIAAWPPLALLLTVELISRVPVHRRSLAAVRLIATAAIAGIAAWVSYWHMAAVAARYGESGAAPYLLPLSVDGLVVVASVSLVELAGRIRSAETDAATRVSPVLAPVATVVTAQVDAPTRPPATAPPAASPAAAPAAAPRGAPLPDGATLIGADRRAPDHPAPPRLDARLVEAKPTRRGRPVAETRRLAAELAARQPDATAEQLARQLGITPKRLRTVLAASTAG